MTSSTSSFRRAFAIALLVVALFGALELVTRKYLFRSSKDLHRFAGYPQRASALMAAPAPHVVLLGNSLTERGIDPQLIAQSLGVSSDLFVADSSHLNTWLWMMRAEFWKRQLSPELVIVTYYGDSLGDSSRLEIGRLAQFFTDHSDWPALFATDVTTLDQRAELVVSSVWATFAVRERIKERVFKLVPGYARYATLENQVNASGQRSSSDRPKPERSWSTLKMFLEDARAHHTHLLFVAFPTRAEDPHQPAYLVPQDSIDAIGAAGMSFLDLRQVPELDPSRHYDDDLHLNAEGREIFTRRLIAEIVRLNLVPLPGKP